MDDAGLFDRTKVDSDWAASKVAGHELKGLRAIQGLRVQGLCFPLLALIDYKGVRLVAVSTLPIDKSTIVCGSDDGGKTLHDKDPNTAAKVTSLLIPLLSFALTLFSPGACGGREVVFGTA